MGGACARAAPVDAQNPDKTGSQKEIRRENGTAAASPSESSRPEGTLTQNMLVDLRLRQARDGASHGPAAGVNRWMTNIVEPAESDNQEIYDPHVRHALSMQSVALRAQAAAVSAQERPAE